MTYPGSVARRCPNIDKAKSELDYSPKIDWEEAVSLTVDWYHDFFTSSFSPKYSGFETPESVLEKVKNY